MALLRLFGNAKKNDKGAWKEYGQDKDHPERTVSFQVRALGRTQDEAFIKKYGSEEKVMLEHGEGNDKRSAYVRQRVMSSDDMKALTIDRAVYSLVDSRNFFIVPMDEEEETILKKWLPPSEVGAGKEVAVDGRLTDDFARYLLTQAFPLAEWVNEQADKVAKEAAAAEGALAKN